MDDGTPQAIAAARIQSGPPSAPQRPLRIALIGWFGSGNFGNDGSCEAAIAVLRQTQPDAHIFCICTDKKGIAERFGVETARLRWWPRGIAAAIDNLLLRLPSLLVNWIYTLLVLTRADVLVFPGTGIFDDYRSGPLGAPSQILRWCAAARLRGVKVVFASVGAGPIRHPLSKRMLRMSAKLAHHRSYRDQVSKDFMQALGVDESASPVLPDVAFALPTPPHETRPEGAPLTIGLGVMAYHGWVSIEAGHAIYENYLAALARFADWLAEGGRRIRLLAGEDSDWRAIRDLEPRLSARAQAALDPISDMASIHDVLREMTSIDLVVGTRFHVVVCALMLARPTISLSYGPKNDALLTAVGLEEFFQPVEQLSFDLLVSQFTKLEAERLRYATIVRERVAGFQARLRESDVFLPPGVAR